MVVLHVAVIPTVDVGRLRTAAYWASGAHNWTTDWEI
jgi:hypothetical protein